MSDLLPQYSGVVSLWAQDVDIFNRWKLSSMLSYAQDVANSHCTLLGCGWNELMTDYRCCYVLTRMHLEIEKYAQSYDKVKITTWPDNKRRILFTRYFTFELESGERLGSAVSEWVLMNVDTRSIVKPADCDIKYPDTSKINAPLKMPKKIFINDDAGISFSKRPVYSDFDYNGHVNNAKYIEWVCDLFPPEHYKDNPIKTIDIRYVQEIRTNDEVTLNLIKKEDESAFFVKGTDSSEKSFFECYGQWQH